MRTPIFSGLAALALVAAVPLVPAKADVCCEVGGVSITHGGGNYNVARGPLSYAGQSVATIGGTAGYGGRVYTQGGYNRNVASGPLSAATQGVTTVGGTAYGPGSVANTYGGYNRNTASGFGSYAGQSVTTVGDSAYPYGHSVTSGGYSSNAAVGAFSQAHQDVTTIGGSAGYGKNLTYGGGNQTPRSGSARRPTSRSSRSPRERHGPPAPPEGGAGPHGPAKGACHATSRLFPPGARPPGRGPGRGAGGRRPAPGAGAVYGLGAPAARLRLRGLADDRRDRRQPGLRARLAGRPADRHGLAGAGRLPAAGQHRDRRRGQPRARAGSTASQTVAASAPRGSLATITYARGVNLAAGPASAAHQQILGGSPLSADPARRPRGAPGGHPRREEACHAERDSPAPRGRPGGGRPRRRRFRRLADLPVGERQRQLRRLGRDELPDRGREDRLRRRGRRRGPDLRRRPSPAGRARPGRGRRTADDGPVVLVPPGSRLWVGRSGPGGQLQLRREGRTLHLRSDGLSVDIE